MRCRGGCLPKEQGRRPCRACGPGADTDMLEGDGCRRAYRDDRHDSRARDGRCAAGERRPSRHRDGARPARVSPLPRRHAAQPGRSGLAGPRPLRPFGRARLHAPVRGAPPGRLRSFARRPAAVPAVGLTDAGPSGMGPHRRDRDDHRATGPGLRERGRDGDRAALPCRSLQPAPSCSRRLVDLRDLLRRRHDGGPHPGGGVDRRPPRARPARLYLRRQPHHDRRHDVALVHDRRQGQALRGVRLARPARRRRRGSGCAARCARRREGGGGAPVADRAAESHRVPGTERGRHLEGAWGTARRGRDPRHQGGDGVRSRRDIRRLRRGARAHGGRHHARCRATARMGRAGRLVGGGVPRSCPGTRARPARGAA